MDSSRRKLVITERREINKMVKVATIGCLRTRLFVDRFVVD